MVETTERFFADDASCQPTRPCDFTQQSGSDGGNAWRLQS